MLTIELPFIIVWHHSWVIKSLQQSWVGLLVRAIISWSQVACWLFTGLNFKPWHLKYSSQNTSAHRSNTIHTPWHQSIQKRCYETKDFFLAHIAQNVKLFGNVQIWLMWNPLGACLRLLWWPWKMLQTALYDFIAAWIKTMPWADATYRKCLWSIYVLIVCHNNFNTVMKQIFRKFIHTSISCAVMFPLPIWNCRIKKEEWNVYFKNN